jgi:hypothetical protein
MRTANDLFRGYNGTEEIYRNSFLRLHYTEGVKAVLEQLDCYWFLDVVGSYQIENKFKKEEFQVWELTRTEGNKFTVTATDGNDNKLVNQKIPFSDFAYDKLTFWKEGDVVLLPSEH